MAVSERKWNRGICTTSVPHLYHKSYTPNIHDGHAQKKWDCDEQGEPYSSNKSARRVCDKSFSRKISRVRS